jgi:26S proteasome regulatory subunit N3
MQAARKAPQDSALGFLRTVHKLAIIVQLLMGDIPERQTFNQKELRVALLPYLHLTQAVRGGDLQAFYSIVEQNAAVFRADKNYTLIQRLGHNVIKTGLRKVNISYSRISLEDIANKLHLPNRRTAEYVCAKAIRDGVIEAILDHEHGWLTSAEVGDVYSTDEPQKAFHRRITFCLDVHNEAVKVSKRIERFQKLICLMLQAMRYPPDAYKKELEKGKPKEDDKTDDQIVKEIEEDLEEQGL